MSQDTERIPIPTNGTGPTPPDGVAERRRSPEEPATQEPTPAFTPTQLAAGFGIIAGLLLLFVGSRRRRGGK